MFKIILKILCLLVFLVDGLVLGQLCGDDSEYKCMCKQKTDEKTHFPVVIADCSGLNIDSFPAKVDQDINYLYLSVNNIEELDPKLQKVVSNDLEILDLSHNKIRSINDEFFLNIYNLRELDLSHNQITSLGDDSIFQNLNNLEKLDLSFNELKTLPNLVFMKLSKLRSLDLGYNYLGEFLTGSKDVLTETLGLNVNITSLSLNGLNISDFHNIYFEEFKGITHLSLANNALDNIPSLPYSVEYLDLSGNNFTFVSARYLNYHSLKELLLNRMPTLKEIHHYAFYNLFALEKLSITDCPNLKTFSELAFDVAPKNERLHPKYLSLARNSLLRLNESYKYFFRTMDQVDLTQNHWRCDCDILWLREFEHILYKPHEIRCFYPSEIRHRSILDLKEKDLPDCYPAVYGKKSHRILIIILVSAVLVLIGLIFYLIRYPTSWLGNKHIGPNSPYNLASTSE
ncbi:toll-like receptor 3 [Anoplophora glabripennis]|uniref:toll-like receptor 3 n=1 Tax=Anoplophora glabripennis TaxID=217634 RepID=UPI0008736C49|nr:toll-like receptor 3 [Anoplophora glabripennis]